jgi:hypothetical protein
VISLTSRFKNLPHDKVEMFNSFNEHFVFSGFLFNSAPHSAVESVHLSNNASDVHNTSNHTPFKAAEVHKALKQLIPRKPSDPDHLEPRFLK